MELEFDPAKNRANIAKHRVDMALAARFEFENAIIAADARREYPETRYQAIGYLSGRLHVMVFVMSGALIRVISLLKANRREQRRYEQTQETG